MGEGKLARVLKGKRRDIKDLENEPPSKVRITNYVRKKANLICEAVRDVHGEPLEWYGYLTGNKDNPRDVEDIELVECLNTHIHTDVLDKKASETIEKIRNKGMIRNGWIHSHGNTSTFHSHTDKNNLGDLVLDTYSNTKKACKMKRVNKNVESVESVDEFDKMEIDETSTYVVGEKAKGIWKPVNVGFCYSIVVNENPGEFDAKIAYRKRKPGNGEKIWIEDAELINVKNYWFGSKGKLFGPSKQLDKEMIREEVRKNIKKGGPFGVI